ncbi:hypothetical protein BT63DRAFT_414917 [Microthyrium microscopicum]|uniref:Uncharacterized protein n=1 Tax=Microthyrium microscopicum TaxID=703497 RepID=A0A6A6U4V9_9PEZI|nr:hypothetical protein BT63DRAFT_414917 [Microthyrium microscopicum]
MASSTAPSAWDDDWENLADKQEAEPQDTTPPPEQKLSRAEPPSETPIFIQARAPEIPLVQAPLKPAFKVLARRPAPKNNATKPSQVAAADDEPDSEEEERIRAAADFADRQSRAAKEREEKQKKYAEVRERLFGPESGNTPHNHSRSGSAGKSAPTSRPESRSGTPRGNGRGRGNIRGVAGNNKSKDNGKLFEPEYAPKPGSTFIQRRETGSVTPSNEERPERQPKGPDGSGRGGFGFPSRVRGEAT